MPVVGDVAERNKETRLLIVVVVAQRPVHARQRRVLAIPRARRLVRAEDALLRVGVAAVAERLVETRDPVVRGGDEHQVAGRPRIERPVSEHARHAEARHLLHVVPADELPLVRHQRIEPRVVRAVADGVVVHVRDRLVQIVQHLRLRVDVLVEDVLRELERHAHRVTVVVVTDVVSPVDRVRRHLSRVGLLPVVDVHHAVASVDLDDRRDERHDVVADVPYIGRIVHGQTICELHQRRRRAGFCRMNGAGDVVDGRRRAGDLRRLLVVHLDRARIGELGERGAILFVLGHDRVRRDRHGDVLASLFGRADRPHLHAIRHRLGEHAHVLVDLLRVRQLSRRAGDVAEHRLWRRHAGLGRHVVDERREEERLGRVLLDLLRVLRVDRLIHRSARRRIGQVLLGARDCRCERDESGERENVGGGTPHWDNLFGGTALGDVQRGNCRASKLASARGRR